jgi:hypothetical protein
MPAKLSRSGSAPRSGDTCAIANRIMQADAMRGVRGVRGFIGVEDITDGSGPGSTLQCERMSLVTGLSALSAATSLTRSLRDGLKSGTIKGDEIAGRIGEIYDHIVDSKDALVEARDEIQELKNQLHSSHTERRKLIDKANEEKQFEFRYGVYWRMYTTGSPVETEEAERGNPCTTFWDGPFCPLCKDSDEKNVRLRDAGAGPPDRVEHNFWCDIHKVNYYAPPGGAV